MTRPHRPSTNSSSARSAGGGALAAACCGRRRWRGRPKPVGHGCAAKADSVIFIWLPGGVAQIDTWDPKRYTPFEAGMKGSQLLGTCPSIRHRGRRPAARRGPGEHGLGDAPRHGAAQPDQRDQVRRGAPQGPVLHDDRLSVSGRRRRRPASARPWPARWARATPNVPPYIYIGRDIDTSDTEKQFISEYIGPGFYGVKHAPFMIPDPTAGLATLSRRRRHRHRAARSPAGLSGRPSASCRADSCASRAKAEDYLKMMEQARAMMDSPVKRAFDYAQDEKPATLAAYEPQDRPRRRAGQVLLLRPAVRPRAAAGPAAGRARRPVRAGRISIRPVPRLRHARRRPERGWSR